MSYQEKKTVITVASGVILLIAYCLTILSQYNLETNANDLKFWATSMLTFIGISIVIMIVIQIVFHILLSISIAVKEKVDDEKVIDKKIKIEMFEDERDHQIELKSLRIGYFFSGIGFILALFSLVLQYPPAIMLNTLFLGFMVGSIIEGIFQFFYYKNGN